MEAPKTTAKAVPLIMERVRAGELLKDALLAVHGSTGFTVGALRTAYYAARGGEGVHHGNNILSAAEDLALLYAAQAFSHTNFPLTRPQLASLVRDLWGKKVGETWARSWVKRHREHLSSRTAKALADKRNSTSVFEEVVDWADQVEKFLKDHRLPPSAILNYDECRLVGGRDRLAVQRIQATDRERPNAASTRGATVASILTFVAANGAPFLSVYIFRARFGDNDAAATRFTLSRVQQRTRGTWLRLYGWTESGFVDAATFAVVMEAFCDEWRLRNPNQECMLIGDQLGAHRQVEVVRAALKSNVLCWWLVANTSHWLQVLDDKCFARIKKVVPVLSDDKIIQALMTNQPTRDCLLEAAYEAERLALTRETIQAAFKSVGLYPWDRKRVIELARVNLGIGLPSDGVADQSRAAAAVVIRQAYDQRAADQKKVVSGVAVVKKAKVYSGKDLIAQHEARVAANAKAMADKEAAALEKEAEKAAKAALRAEENEQRKLLVCRACDQRVHRSSKEWHVCTCGSYRVCPPCLKNSEGKAMVSAHIVVCSDVSDHTE